MPTSAKWRGTSGIKDWLETATIDGRPWNKTSPAPRLPREAIEQTAAKYQEALKRLPG